LGDYLMAGGRPFSLFEKECMMTQSEIDRAVAARTGETVPEIRHLGFGIADPRWAEYDPEPSSRSPLMIDWDSLYPINVGP
jgi:hypothetical protein